MGYMNAADINRVGYRGPWDPQGDPQQSALLQQLLQHATPGGSAKYDLMQGVPPGIVGNQVAKYHWLNGLPPEVAKMGQIDRYRYMTGQRDRIGR